MEEDIFFFENFTKESSNILLFELPQDLMLEIENHALRINGSHNNDAIICGKDSSYLIKKNETSNSLLLLDKTKIFKVSHETYILEKIIPPLHQVYNLLKESPYTFQDQSIL